MYEVIRRIVDDGNYFDLKPQWAKTIITCLARFGGRPAGIVANQPKQLGGILDNDSADKAARFINLCNAYGAAARLPDGRPGLHGRNQGRAGGDHPPRRQDAVRDRERHGPEDHRRAPQGVRRRLLRDVRPRVRARPDRRLALGRDQRDGGRGRGRDHLPQAGPGGRGPRGKARRADRELPRDHRRLHRGGQRHDRRRHRPAGDASRRSAGRSRCRRESGSSGRGSGAGWCRSDERRGPGHHHLLR